MIYDELRNYISQVRTDDTVFLFDRAIKIFDKHEVPGYMEVFENTITSLTDHDEETKIISLFRDIETICLHLLNIQGIKLIDECDLNTILEITDAVFELGNYEDKAVINQILTNDENAVETFSQLLELTSNRKTEELISFIQQVNDSTIAYIKDISNQIKQEEPIDFDLDKMITNYKNYKSIFNKDLFSDRFLNSVNSLGMSYLTYLNVYENNAKYLNDITEKASFIAEELVGLALISNDGYENPLIIINQNLKELYLDMNVITKMNLEVTKVLDRYHRG